MDDIRFEPSMLDGWLPPIREVEASPRTISDEVVALVEAIATRILQEEEVFLKGSLLVVQIPFADYHKIGKVQMNYISDANGEYAELGFGP